MNSASHITIDDTHWPLLVVHFVGSPSLAQCREFFEQRAAYLERGEKHIGISDATRMKLPPPEFRQLQAEWIARNTALLARTFLGTASIIQAPDILLLKSAAAHRTTLPYPTTNVTSMGAGVAWAVERLADAGLQEAALRLRHAFGLEPVAPPADPTPVRHPPGTSRW
jgi:hypothetical protein